MQVKSSRIQLNGIHLYGFHGVSAEEQAVGSWFQIDVSLNAKVTFDALNHDNLRGTVDYSGVLEVIKKEFAVNSKLMEHLAYRIAKRLFSYSQSISQIQIRIQKKTPPMPTNVDSSAVEFIFDN